MQRQVIKIHSEAYKSYCTFRFHLNLLTCKAFSPLPMVYVVLQWPFVKYFDHVFFYTSVNVIVLSNKRHKILSLMWRHIYIYCIVQPVNRTKWTARNSSSSSHSWLFLLFILIWKKKNHIRGTNQSWPHLLSHLPVFQQHFCPSWVGHVTAVCFFFSCFSTPSHAQVLPPPEVGPQWAGAVMSMKCKQKLKQLQLLAENGLEM